MLGEGEEPLLTDEETSALLDAMRDEDTRDQPEAERTDLGSPEGPLREALGRADASLGALASAARDQLLRQTIRGVQVEMLPAEIVPRDVLHESFDARAIRYSLRYRGHRYGSLVVDPGLAAYVLDRSLGGEVEKSGQSGPRAFSELDRRVLRPFPEAVAVRLSETFLDGLRVELVDAGLADAEEDDRIVSVRFEPLLRLGLRVNADGAPVGDLSLALNATAVSSSSGDFDEPRSPRPDPKTQVSRRLVAAHVQLSAILGRTSSNVRALLTLREGDVLRLDRTPEDLVPVLVDDVVVAEGLPVVHHGNLAIDVRSRPGESPP
jgi:flagellar motor switch protein FliM